MDEESLGSRPDDSELPSADTATPQDLSHAVKFLVSLVSPKELDVERYRRIRHVADWICAATTTLMTPAGDFADILDVWGRLEPGELSHAMLISILMDNGGSHTVAPSAMAPDALAGRDGALHAASLEQLPNGLIRISVCPRPDTDTAGTDFGYE